MIRAVLGIILIVVFSTGCEEVPSSNFPAGTVKFELDYQSNCDPFTYYGPAVPTAIFPRWCKPEFHFDDENFTPEMVELDANLMWDYWRAHGSFNVNGTDSVARYPFYLGGITQFKEHNGTPIWTVYGATVPEFGAAPRNVFSLFCRDVVDSYAIPDKMEVKVICHELGHQLGHFIHLCDDYGNYNYADHSDNSCLMGKGDTTCTYQSLLANIHFCSKCRDSLGRIEGRTVQP